MTVAGDDKKRILIVLYYYHPYVSGLSMLAKMQAEGLASRGYEVTVLTTQYAGELAHHEVLNGVHVVRAKVLAKAGKGVVSWDLLKKVVAYSKTHDIVNPHLPMAHFGLILPFIDTRKLVTQYHCDLNLGSGWLSCFLQRISYWSMGRTLARSSQIIATTKDYFSASQFAKYTPRVKEIYPPIDQRRFERRDSSELRARLGLKGTPHLIGFVGRIVEEKGLEYLLLAIPFLEKTIGEFLILIAGDSTKIAGGSVKKEIDTLVSKFPERVKFTGYLKFDDLVAFYNLIEVLVLPSVDPLEAFGMVQVESMLCGTPVIATDMPGVREAISKTGFGKLVRKRDPKDIAEKILDVIINPILIDRESLTAFSYESSIDKYENVFRELISLSSPDVH